MERIVHPLIQGSPEWCQFKLTHDGASEAAAMLGLSKKTKRTELLRMKSTGLAKEFGEWLQENILDRGHEIEALARPFAVEFAGVDGFYPATISIGRISASTDGCDMLDETAWECKTLNKENGPIVRAGNVPDEHMPQCQQVLMVTGADRLLFTVSDGTRENTFHTWVEPDTDWFDRLRAGWRQFNEDLANYQHVEADPAPVAVAQPSLPAVVVRMDGALTVVSNLPDFAVALRAYIERIPAKPSTDQEFADAEAACKALKNAESALEQAENNALSQMSDVEQMRRVVGDLRTLSKTTRLATEKLVAARKETIRTEIYQEGIAAYKAHIDGLNKRIGRPYMPVLPVDFAGAIKNKRTVDSLRDAVSTHLANAKIAANDVADKISLNMATLRELAAGHATLFPDTAALVLKGNDDLTALVKTRIAEHTAAEQRRAEELAEQQRARIAEEERVKAEANVREAQDIEDRLIASLWSHARRIEFDSVPYIEKAIGYFESGAKDWDNDPRPRVVGALAAARAEMNAKMQAAKLREELAATQAREERERRDAEALALSQVQAPAVSAPAASAPPAETIDQKTGEITSGFAFQRPPPERIAAAAAALAPQAQPTLNMSRICTALGFTISADFLTSIGMPPVKVECNSSLYHEHQILAILEKLGEHLSAVWAREKSKLKVAA